MEVSTILKRASEKSGSVRARYREKDVPTSIESVTVLPFFGDRRSSVVLSSLLLRRIREELKGSRYFVLLSWPGDEGLFPYVDEYWQVEEEGAIQKLSSDVHGFSNNSSVLPTIQRSLNQYIYDVMSDSDLAAYYDNGLTAGFFERFRHVKVSLPSIPSVSSLGADLSRTLSKRDNRVLVRPSRTIASWRNGSLSWVKAPREFWASLLSHLVSEGFNPVVLRDIFCYDLSSEVLESCLHIRSQDILKDMSVMRSCGMVLDIFDGSSRLAIAARSPFLCFDERQRFSSQKEYEINDLCGRQVPREYIYSFAALVEKGGPSVWKSNIFDHMTVKLREMVSSSDRDSWPAPIETNEIVPYDSVRRRKLKRLGSRFIKVERD
jgi:hypothetical protein